MIPPLPHMIGDLYGASISFYHDSKVQTNGTMVTIPSTVDFYCSAISIIYSNASGTPNSGIIEFKSSGASTLLEFRPQANGGDSKHISITLPMTFFMAGSSYVECSNIGTAQAVYISMFGYTVPT